MNTPKHVDPEDMGYELDRAGALWQFHTARYAVAFFAEPEDMNPADSFSDARDVEFARGAYGERGWGCSGEPAKWFCAVVAVYDEHGDMIGMDSLGGCSYHSFREFYASHRWQYSRNGKWITDPKSRAWKACEARRPRRSDGSRADSGYFTGMVREAIRDARVTLARHRDGMVSAA